MDTQDTRDQLIELLMDYLEKATGRKATVDDVANIPADAKILEELSRL